MSNIVVPPSFQGQVAAVFQGQGAGEDLSGGITGGYGLIKYRGKVWSIQHNGNSVNLMREDGDGPRGSIDVVILKANAQLSKTFYINGWDENNNNPPDCASANGIAPDQGVPHPQSTVCATCPKNAWGSAPNGGKGKACGDHRRMAVVPLTDLRNEFYGGPLLLRCPAASLQDMAAFDSRYKALGYPYFTMGIKIGFDPVESYPKFTFQAIRPLTQEEGVVVMEMRNSAETARVVHEGTAPAPAQVAAQPQGAFLEAPPENAVQPQVSVRPVAQQPVQPAQQQPAQQPVVAQPEAGAQPASNVPAAQPVQATNVQPVQPATAGGFGPAAAPAPSGQPQSGAQPTGQPAAAPQQPVNAGGFGPAAAPAPSGQPQSGAQPTGQPAAAPQQPVNAGGFGPAAAQPGAGNPQPAATPAQAPAVPQASRPALQMTGFGPTTEAPAVTPQGNGQAPAVTQPAAQTAAAVPPVSTGVVSAFEGSIDERLNALLGN